MSDEDDYYVNQTSSRARPKTYLDLVEFCRAEFDESLLTSDQPVVKQQRSSSSERINRFREKISESRIVDFGVLNKFQVQYHSDFSQFQEHLLCLGSIDVLNRFTSFLPLNRLFKGVSNAGEYNFDLLNTKKKLIVDTSVYKILKSHRQINWSSTLNKLYPIKTIGDGNCLCHACLSYLIGFQDVNLVLREALRTYMTDLECNKALKKRWLRNREQSDTANAIQTEEKLLNQEWDEISNLKSSEKEADKDGEKAKESSKTASLSLIFLEDIHIFALANFLRRPIIILSLETYKNIQPIQLRGIYLPLLNKPQDCFKEPIVIAFHNFHFMPLLYALDDQDSAGTILDEKQFHFNGVDKIDTEKLSSFEYELKNNFEKTAFKSNDISVNKMATRQGKSKRLLNYLPLHYHNLQQMEVHFLNADEEKIERDLLEKYLNLKKVILEVDEAEPEALPYLDSNKEVELTCCTLTSQRKTAPGDGIATYIDFLNESIYKNSLSGGVRSSTEFSPVSSSLVPTDTSYSPKTTSLPKYIQNYCAIDGCTNRPMDPSVREYRGLCKDCFRELIQLQKENDESRAPTRSSTDARRITRSSASKENQYQGSSGLYSAEPVTSNITVLKNRDNYVRCLGNNCSQKALDGESYCHSCLMLHQRLAEQKAAQATKYVSGADPYYTSSSSRTGSGQQREIPITVLSKQSTTNTSFQSSNNRGVQIPINYQSESLSSPYMTPHSKLYNHTMLDQHQQPSRVNYDSAYSDYPETAMYDSLGRRSQFRAKDCRVCHQPLGMNESPLVPGVCITCRVRRQF